VQFVVESAGVTDGLSSGVPSPEGGFLGATVVTGSALSLIASGLGAERYQST
jgi:hypothetical protein